MCRVVGPAVVALLVAAVLAVFFPASVCAQKESDLPRPKQLAELQQGMKEVVEKEHVPGAGVALVANGELLWCGGIGKADIAANRAVTCDTEFRVGGISKTFVALALLKLQEEGKINLYARLQDIAPQIPFTNQWATGHPLRIGNVLNRPAASDDLGPSAPHTL